MKKTYILESIRAYLDTVHDSAKTSEEYTVVVKHLQDLINDTINDEIKKGK